MRQHITMLTAFALLIMVMPGFGHGYEDQFPHAATAGCSGRN